MFQSQQSQHNHWQRLQHCRQQQKQKPKQQPNAWLLIFFSCILLQPLCTHSTPVHIAQVQAQQSQHDRGPCAHESIAELIRTSPVILKALGAHIFTEDDFNGMGMPQGRVANELKSYSYRQQNELLASATLEASAMATSTTPTSALQTGNNAGDTTLTYATMATATTSPEMESILITLTPETIYKGASLLKMSPGSESAAHSNSFINANAVESTTPFEGQLNATLQPAHCFDSALLQLLPTELIVFGKLITTQQQLHLLRPQEPQIPLAHFTKGQEDVLHISINGFHRWNPQFENHIWKHLGWDDWSDFTLCSVTCGKGVQQRFRRCLLDNPMVNLNMNENLNIVDADTEDVAEDDFTSDDDILADDSRDKVGEDVALNIKLDEAVGRKGYQNTYSDPSIQTTKSTISETSEISYAEFSSNNSVEIKEVSAAMNVNATQPRSYDSASITAPVAEELGHLPTVTLTRDNNELSEATNILNSLNDDDGKVMRTKNIKEPFNETDKRPRKAHKRRRASKTLETMFCEGYNIEQRNCNTFECTDDISDLLKFYKRPMLFEEFSTSSAPLSDLNHIETGRMDVRTLAPIADVNKTAYAPGVDDSIGINASSLANSTPSTTPANMGYVRSWHNPLNFTVMLTLRVKNDSKNTATIFSVHNTSHNLYLDQCQDGLRLYMERDNSSEMLPVKFNLYDYRWHQVAISIQNGDFISIFVDCSWTNSFVVSKRLFTLPLDADVEIGRGFNGELQQLLLLPGNQERHQCSSRRTSINEVKRYIIDTFIGDYSN